jgi:hypothetical protein
MADTDRTDALEALMEAERLVTRLEKMCCEPGRSPAMKRLAETLAGARLTIESSQSNLDLKVLDALEDAGAQLGRLQVGCCAPARMPLYAGALDKLTEIQLSVNRDAGTAH